MSRPRAAVTWSALDDRAFDDLTALAAAVLAADGGLRVAAHPAFLRSRWRADGTTALAARERPATLAAGDATAELAAGDGTTGLGAGDGTTGLGAGDGTTGLGAGDGTTGLGAGDGTTGLGAGDGTTGPGPRDRIIRFGARDSTTALGVREGGHLIAAAALRPHPGEPGPRFTALVHPAHRNRGLGSHLLDRGLAHGAATVETESLTPAAEALFTSRGLRQTFAEDVLRFDLTAGVPQPEWPHGTTLREWTAETGPRFFAVYEAAFRERPGFPGYPAQEWIADVGSDDDVRPDWCVLATVPGVGDAGFVLAEPGRIVQVGVVPAARGAGLGAALVREALRRIGGGGAAEAFLEVNVDNPAGRLYRRLGFTEAGRRARFTRPALAGPVARPSAPARR